MHLRIFFDDQRFSQKEIQTKNFEYHLQKIAQLKLPNFPKKDSVLELIFINDREIRKLNFQYRAKNKPTDVLSFSLPEKQVPEPSAPMLFGQICISLPTAKRQASEHRHSLSQELNILFVHGVLHLLGYDHENDTDFQKMKVLEKKILAAG